MDRDFIRSVENGKARQGKLDLLRYLKGERLTQRHAIRAKCYDCNGMGEQTTCDIQECALWPYSPFRELTTAKGAKGSA